MLIKINDPASKAVSTEYLTHFAYKKPRSKKYPNGKIEKTRYKTILEERKRLAQELHDSLAPSLGYLNLQIALATSLLSKGQVTEAQATLEEVKDLISDSYADVREEIFNLRTKMVQNGNFINTLRQYLDKYRRYYNFEVKLVIESDHSFFEFLPQIGVQLIRVIQEALTNVRKHAQVKQALIRLKRERCYVVISVEDCGMGFDFDERKDLATFGLQIMRERVESIQGSLEISTTSGQGTHLIVRVPLSLSKNQPAH